MAASQESLGRVIVIGNLKGGTGKSTVTVNLAGALASLGRQVAIVDTDPQGTAYEWVLRGKLDMLCLHRPLQRMEESGDWIKVTTSLRQGHEIVVVDLPSVVAPALAAAYFIADLILVPASPSGVDASGTRRALRYVELARAERRENPPAVLVVPSRVPDFGPDWARTENLLETLGEKLAPPLRFLPDYDKAFRSGQWVGAAAPDSAARGDVEALARVVLQALGLEEAAPAARDAIGIIRPPSKAAALPTAPSTDKPKPPELPASVNEPFPTKVPPAKWWTKILGRRAKRF